MSSGRHRGPALLGTRAKAGLVIVALVAAIGALVLWQSGGSGGTSSCSGEQRLTVAAAPEIATAIRDTANAWASGVQSAGGKCVAVDVTAANSLDVTMAVAARGGVTLTGLSTATTAAGASASPANAAAAAPAPVVPDVWVPDSSTWLVRIRVAGPNLVPPQAQSIARSPIVLAMPEPIAKSLGWPGAAITWPALLQRMTTGPALKVGIVEPNRDATGLSGLVALGAAAAASGAGAEQATIAAMRALVAGRTTVAGDLLAKFPKSAEPAALAAGLSAAPLSEQAMLSYNQTSPAVKLAALYVEPAPPALDYPFAIMPGLSGDKASLAEQLRAALSGDVYRSRLSAAGLRDQDGVVTFPAPPGAPATVPAGVLDGPTLAKALTTWISVTRPARMLAVIDISGSMALPVPTAGGATRSQVSVAAAQQGLVLFDDSWSVGLWTFSTKLDNGNDWRELLPIKPMSEQRAKLQQALTTVAPIPNGETGLYDTVLAAYKTVQAGWDPRSVNSVVLLTDGQNQDANGISLDALIEQLKGLVDPKRPIQVIAIGIGDDVSEAELTRITSTTGGGTFIARDPSAIGPIFIKALSLRPPLPT
jgi:hypothetical protein